MKLACHLSLCGWMVLALGGAAALAKKPTTRPSSDWKPTVVDAPATRVGGAARACSADPELLVSLLSPASSMGLTASAQPTLYWYVTKPTKRPIEISLIPLDKDGKDVGNTPILDLIIPKTDVAGIQALSLARLPAGHMAVSLAPGIQYAWVVEAVVHDRNGSDNPSATTRLRCVKPSDAVAAVQALPPAEQYDVYRQAGLWYDMLDSLNRMIDADNADTDLRQTRRELLDGQNLIEDKDGKIVEKSKKS